MTTDQTARIANELREFSLDGSVCASDRGLLNEAADLLTAQSASNAGGGVMTDQTALEQAVLRIIADGRGKCGIGFGKYPLGIRAAVVELLPLVSWSEEVRERLADFDARLAQ